MTTTTDSLQTLLSAIASNGPWAAAFAYAFRTILLTWQDDRKNAEEARKEYNTTVINTLSGLKDSVDLLRSAIERAKP